MSYFIEGEGLLAAAEAYWLGRGKQPEPSKEEALEALDVVTQAVTNGSGSYEISEPEDEDPDSHLGRLVAIAFDATDEEKAEPDKETGTDPWREGPLQRFREHYNLT